MTLPQIRQGIAMILHEAFQCGTTPHMLKEHQKRLQRNELARFYHWKQRNNCVIRTGDAITFVPAIPHQWENSGAGPAHVVIVTRRVLP